MVLGIYGSGGGGNETKEIALELGQWDEVVFIDDMVSADQYKGVRRMPFEEFVRKFDTESAEIVISLGEPMYKIALREKIEKAGYSMGNVIHPLARVSPSAVLGKGIILRAWSCIGADTIIKDNVTVMEYSAVGHDSVVGENVQIAGGVFLGGHCTVGDNTYIAIGVPIKDSITIGRDVVVGIGSVVSRNLPDNVIAMGNPARSMKHKDGKRIF